MGQLLIKVSCELRSVNAQMSKLNDYRQMFKKVAFSFDHMLTLVIQIRPRFKFDHMLVVKTSGNE